MTIWMRGLWDISVLLLWNVEGFAEEPMQVLVVGRVYYNKRDCVYW